MPPPLYRSPAVADARGGFGSLGNGYGAVGLGLGEHPLFEEELVRGGGLHASTRLRFRQDVGRQAARIAEAAGGRVPRESRERLVQEELARLGERLAAMGARVAGGEGGGALDGGRGGVPGGGGAAALAASGGAPGSPSLAAFGAYAGGRGLGSSRGRPGTGGAGSDGLGLGADGLGASGRGVGSSPGTGGGRALRPGDAMAGAGTGADAGEGLGVAPSEAGEALEHAAGAVGAAGSTIGAATGHSLAALPASLAALEALDHADAVADKLDILPAGYLMFIDVGDEDEAEGEARGVEEAVSDDSAPPSEVSWDDDPAVPAAGGASALPKAGAGAGPGAGAGARAGAEAPPASPGAPLATPGAAGAPPPPPPGAAPSATPGRQPPPQLANNIFGNFMRQIVGGGQAPPSAAHDTAKVKEREAAEAQERSELAAAEAAAAARQEAHDAKLQARVAAHEARSQERAWRRQALEEARARRAAERRARVGPFVLMEDDEACVLVVGRDPACTVQVLHEKVSGQHVQFRVRRIYRQDGGRPGREEGNGRGYEVVLKDLSTNGTYVNGVKVGKGREVVLAYGDEVRLVSEKRARKLRGPVPPLVLRLFAEDPTGPMAGSDPAGEWDRGRVSRRVAEFVEAHGGLGSVTRLTRDIDHLHLNADGALRRWLQLSVHKALASDAWGAEDDPSVLFSAYAALAEAGAGRDDDGSPGRILANVTVVLTPSWLHVFSRRPDGRYATVAPLWSCRLSELDRVDLDYAFERGALDLPGASGSDAQGEEEGEEDDDDEDEVQGAKKLEEAFPGIGTAAGPLPSRGTVSLTGVVLQEFRQPLGAASEASEAAAAATGGDALIDDETVSVRLLFGSRLDDFIRGLDLACEESGATLGLPAPRAERGGRDVAEGRAAAAPAGAAADVWVNDGDADGVDLARDKSDAKAMAAEAEAAAAGAPGAADEESASPRAPATGTPLSSSSPVPPATAVSAAAAAFTAAAEASSPKAVAATPEGGGGGGGGPTSPASARSGTRGASSATRSTLNDADVASVASGRSDASAAARGPRRP